MEREPPDNLHDRKVVSIADFAANDVPKATVINHRRYGPEACNHKGPYIVDSALNVVECGDCGAMLNPMFVLERIAYGEAYWNARYNDLTKHLADLKAEIEGRARTRCTHCGNMTAIRYEAKQPQTWVRDPAAYR